MLRPPPRYTSYRSSGASVGVELQRLLYVACTRPETTLHLLGHVSERTGKAAAGSLLYLLLSGDENCFGAQLFNIEAVEQTANTGRQALQRVKYVAAITPLEIASQSEPETEYVWAGAEAAPVGNALHAALQYIAEVGIEHWGKVQTEAALKRMSRMLAAEGMSGTLLETASARCADGLYRVLRSEKGRWILSDQHQQARSEWALSSEYEHHISHHVIDRSFIDNDGIRWIIDYKTAAHEGGGLGVFLNEEGKRHAPQLHRYAAIVAQLEPEREIRTALYFPMLDAWKEVVV